MVYLLINLIVDLLYGVLNPQYTMDRKHYGNSPRQYPGSAVSSAAIRTSLEARARQTGADEPHALSAWGADYCSGSGWPCWRRGLRRIVRRKVTRPGTREPSLTHLFGLDKYGRDILTRVVYGSRYDLFIAVTVVGCSLVVGTCIGSISGFLGGKIDNLIMRLMDMLLAFPSFVLALVFVPSLARR